jgi:aspartyl-tRNA(Asn)/glutamyl-tRNA(Gln) amidotransferase subunit A
MTLTSMTLREARDGLRRGDFSAVELTEAYLARIHALDDTVKAYITVTEDEALQAAQRADERRQSGEDGPLLGLPIAVKDVLVTEDVETTCASKILKGYIPPYTATAVQRLQDAGMVMLGKTNTDEFAMGSSTENSGFFTTRNPWSTDHVPGGSSGGSAAAVAAQLAPVALGTDTGGSVRLPASYCGVVALKPTYGRVSRYGLVAFASSLDSVGSFGRTVRDAADVLQAMAGHDPQDSTSLGVPVPDYSQAFAQDIAGLKVGVPREFFAEGLQPEVEQAVRAALEQFEQLGVEIRDVTLPNSEYAISTYYLIATAEASSNLARYEGVRFGVRESKSTLWDTYRATRGEGFGPEVKRRIMLGTYALSSGYYDAYYLKAQKVRTLLRSDFDRAFADVDVIIGPTAPSTAFKIGEKVNDPLEMYLSDIFTVTANMVGICAMSLPCGFDNAGLPIGLQVIAPSLQEEMMLRVGHAYEQATSWHTQTPSL